ncbi:MAG: hypothetical protein FWF51_04390 [Chitinivibrionia bacterium]|nr:hypothetical protein [Chitinivibrionia bacterium]
MARPFKEESAKATETITIRLNNTDANALSRYAGSLEKPIASVVTKILENEGCFDYDISDDVYLSLQKSPEINYVVSQRIPLNERNVIRCRITKKQKRALTYFAITKHKTSPLILIRDIIKTFLLSRQEKEKTENSEDIIVKDLWTKISEETKKELVEDYLKNKK